MHQEDFFHQALVYLLAAVISVPVAKRLGFGSVLGYLLAGIIIGPFLLGLIGSEGEDVMHFAEFGVVMMLFLIGLELKPNLLWEMRRSIFGLGGLQLLVTTLFIGGVAILLGQTAGAGIAIGLMLTLSSTAIVLQTLAEKGIMKQASGQASFSVLLFQDMAVIPILALLPLLAATEAVNSAIH
ncbi:MAG: cation:proton antiporter, partial [Bacteroidales bacterium]|nr:cation:proton antiporter [Bacteroidales bacterium]